MANIDQTPFFVRCKMQFRHFAGIKTFFVERAINAKMIKKVTNPFENRMINIEDKLVCI